ncbi:hypothetical protein HanRHA438_Chr16g0746271 [Helianthus annuus]|uniref:DUF7815 domain-containing protein n=1 Tax=Helianthus annuus TaxID=4232 RepID=A0A251RXN8_HELAN|nr:dentin sialophosphoprotein [Helianthus annuus]KAF5758821.1 hypothetical protein HanXRQr2_Chr16g0733831 [Helianthus annuus]KAJ0437113.1 hypothetical protein HanHA300_Chr16g0598351 [Helianthus annuus]KAJ0459425.1 hypothetical protein HanHA89_Chr16g0648821 [Helianthus annuus]KAJ0639954.1 hypothetical protein HanLR1_Chr16g0609651 [Helianthus annuus]KAJ0643907.1 hypothetical protein HanOQP8_Chr16g0605841 [Helianthus annuus]
MDFDTPSDLIHKAQIGFKQAAGLSSFNRNDTTLPSISTVEASISSLDPSPPYLRCKFCHGKLLRGLQSLICVYCGEYQKKDLDPEPISFSSTHGYSWLIQSLNFNGSERVGSLAEGGGVNGGQSAAEDELTLSDLLDLKISWREPEKPESNISIKTSDHNSSSNLDSTDFDDFFTKSTSKSATAPDVLKQQPVAVASKADQNTIVEDQESLTDWNAEFQFADTKIESEKRESVDLFAGSEADVSANIDAVFVQTESFDFEKPNSASDPFQDDLFANMPDVDLGQTESFDFDKPNNASDPFQDDLFANVSSKTFQQNDQLDSVLQAKDDLPGDRNDSSLKRADDDWFSDDNWQKSSVKSTLNDVSVQDNPNVSSTDWFENTNNTATIKEDSLFDIKPHANDTIPFEKSDVNDWFQDSQWAIGGSSSTTTTNVVVSNVDDDNDGFGEWNDFTSSTGNQDSVQDSWKESGTEKVDYGSSEKMSELDLFQSAVDSQDVDFGNFMQSDMFSGDKNTTVTQTVYDIFSELPTGNRIANTEAGNNAEGLNKDEITSTATTSPKDDVQMLMSQMHDLSFMLKNELSVPSKPDDIGTSHS